MGLFNFGKPKDEVLEAKLKKLTSDVEAKKSDLAKLKQEIRTSREIISLDAELILKKEEIAHTISEELRRGVTVLDCVGYFSNENMKMLYFVLIM